MAALRPDTRAVLDHAELCLSLPFSRSQRFSAAATSRRTASGRLGFGSGWEPIQASIAARASRSKRTLTASLSTRGRPRFDFLAPSIGIEKFIAP